MITASVNIVVVFREGHVMCFDSARISFIKLEIFIIMCELSLIERRQTYFIL